MLLPPNITVEEPVDPDQIRHLARMDDFFGNDFEKREYKELTLFNLAYGVMNTSSLDEYMDTLRTSLYWLNDKYSHTLKTHSVFDVLKTYTRLKEGEEVVDDYKMDMVFSDWTTSSYFDSLELRELFKKSLKTDEKEFIPALAVYKDDMQILETLCINWIKKITDPVVIVSFSNYMVYMLTKASIIAGGQDCKNIEIMMTNLYKLIHEHAKAHVMASHNLHMN